MLLWGNIHLLAGSI